MGAHDTSLVGKGLIFHTSRDGSYTLFPWLHRLPVCSQCSWLHRRPVCCQCSWLHRRPVCSQCSWLHRCPVCPCLFPMLMAPSSPCLSLSVPNAHGSIVALSAGVPPESEVPAAPADHLAGEGRGSGQDHIRGSFQNQAEN